MSLVPRLPDQPMVSHGQFNHKLPAANKACGCNYYTGSQSHPGPLCLWGEQGGGGGVHGESARDFGPSHRGVAIFSTAAAKKLRGSIIFAQMVFLCFHDCAFD